MITTYRYRLKDGKETIRKRLRAQARSINFIWNYCCQIDREAYARWKAGLSTRRPSAFDLVKLCTGVSKELGIHSDSISVVCHKFVAARNACFPKTPRFRSAKRNLDWVPFGGLLRSAKLEGDAITFMGKTYKFWLDRSIPESSALRSWNLSTNSEGRWFINIAVELPDAEKQTGLSVGIDLGLKALATLSDGHQINAPRFFRASAEKLALAQRRKQKARARQIQAKIARQRRHFLHVETTKIAEKYGHIVVGDVSASRLKKTRMAKSVSDAGWTMFRNFLSYKAIARGKKFSIVNEAYSSQTCSECGSLPSSRPKGIAGLGIRVWTCDDCGAEHDRDVNAAKNILAAEHRRPVVGISSL